MLGCLPLVVQSEVKVTGSLRGGVFCVFPALPPLNPLVKGDPPRLLRPVVLVVVVCVCVLYQASLSISWASTDLQTRHRLAQREGCEITLDTWLHSSLRRGVHSRICSASSPTTCLYFNAQDFKHPHVIWPTLCVCVCLLMKSFGSSKYN